MPWQPKRFWWPFLLIYTQRENFRGLSDAPTGWMPEAPFAPPSARHWLSPTNRYYPDLAIGNKTYNLQVMGSFKILTNCLYTLKGFPYISSSRTPLQHPQDCQHKCWNRTKHGPQPDTQKKVHIRQANAKGGIHIGDFSIPTPIVKACGLSFSSSGANRTILCSVLLVYHQMLPVTDIRSTFPNREVNASPLDGKFRYINHYADNLSVIMTYTKS